MPKRSFAIKPGTVTVIFHQPIEPKEFGTRDCLMARVRQVIDGSLPIELQEAVPPPLENASVREGKASA
jgi:hypothetical protein